jgi:hypothetical protein
MHRMALRTLVVALLVLASGFGLLMGSKNLPNPPAAPAQEQTDPQTDPQTNPLGPFDCETFAYQEDAQLWYDRDHTDPSNLDDDNDGIACEELPSGPTPSPGGDGLTTPAPPSTTTTTPPTTPPTASPPIPPPSTTTGSGRPERGPVSLLPGGEDTSETTAGETEEATVVVPPVKETLTPGSNNVGKPPINKGKPSDDDVGHPGNSKAEEHGRGGGEKVTVCHKGKKTLSIGAPALAAHLGHGDWEGSCSRGPQAAKNGGGGGSGGPDKVTLCHKDKKTLTVGAPAQPAHLGHGDYLGACSQP